MRKWAVDRFFRRSIAGLAILLGLCGVCTACGASQGDAAGDGEKPFYQEEHEDISGCLRYSHREAPDYASQFALDYYSDDTEEEYVLISISDGSRFLVVPEKGRVPEDLAGDIKILKQPMSDIYLVASATMDMFRAMDALDTISLSGIARDSWHIEEARRAMERGEMVYAGKYSAPDYELLVSSGCRLSVQSTMVERVPEVKEQLELLGIPVLVDYSSYEEHPLGRSEWVKLYGVITGRREAAGEAFEAQKAAFAKGISEEPLHKTVAFFYVTSSGAVNVRKSGDYIPRMIELAGGSYILTDLQEEDSASGTMNLQMEEFYSRAKDADYLVYSSAIGGELSSVSELLERNPLFADFKAVQSGNVWCATEDLYQSSMELGTVTEDFHRMLTAEDGEDGGCTYLFRLQ